MARRDSLIKIVPVRISFLYELNLPLAIPLLQLLLPLNGRFDIGELLKINETVDTVLSGEPRNKFRAMLINASHQTQECIPSMTARDSYFTATDYWMPAFAGMTMSEQTL